MRVDLRQRVRRVSAFVIKLAGLAAVACATVPSGARHASLLRYIATAHEQLERCVTVAVRRPEYVPAPRMTRASSEAVCGARAQAELNGVYGAAKDEVRLERGTTMYLDRYKRDWMQVMLRLDTDEVLTNEQLSKLQKQLAELDDIAAKLRR